MIKDITEKNNNVTLGAKEVEVLRENFPACFHADGSFDIERFKEYLKDKINVTDEGYELRFLGKNYARLLASLDTTTVVVPDEKHNSMPENKDSKNVYISGDNIDALKHLLKSYAGRTLRTTPVPTVLYITILSSLLPKNCLPNLVFLRNRRLEFLI